MTGALAIIFGLIILCGAVYLLIKQYETRTVLLGAGFLMAAVALEPLKAFDAFSTRMVAAGFIQNICSALGFAMVLQLTGCDKHLIFSMTKVLDRIRPFIIPGVAIATFCINIAVVSAAGCAATVGVIFIPLLISQGVSPAIAASAVMLGTFGSMLSPGLSHNPMIADLANITIIEVIKGHMLASIACMLVGAASLVVVAKIRKEDKGFDSSDWESVDHASFKVNPLFAILPLVPIIVLVGFSFEAVQEQISWAKSFKVPHAMLFGAFLCMFFTRTNPQDAVKKFFDGMSKGYGDILGIIIAAAVFVSGLNALGIIDGFIALLNSTQSIVKVAATYGPFALAVISGSGDAAALAFNEAVTPHAQNFGLEISNMGSLAALAGTLGRTMSPLAGAAIICAGLARVNPFEIAKRNAPGMLIASVVAMLMLVGL